jgi:hypothetical protein
MAVVLEANLREERGKTEGKAERRESEKEVLKGLFPLSLPSLFPFSSLCLSLEHFVIY